MMKKVVVGMIGLLLMLFSFLELMNVLKGFVFLTEFFKEIMIILSASFKNFEIIARSSIAIVVFFVGTGLLVSSGEKKSGDNDEQ